MLTDEGVVYSWGGKNDHGELGRSATTQDLEKKPSPIGDAIKAEVIVSIACGHYHCLALSKSGVLYSWGWNKAGQLGKDNLTATTPQNQLLEKSPVQVKPFTGTEDALIVKSCSCGPESSACVTTKGDIYVWGAVSHYLFKLGGCKYAHGENVSMPVKLKNVPNSKDCKPDMISCYKDRLATTMGHADLLDELENTINALKTRSATLMSLTRHWKVGTAKLDIAEDDENLGVEELNNLNAEFKKHLSTLKDRIKQVHTLRSDCELELQGIGRELTVCDQQDTAFTDDAAKLEVKLGELNVDAQGRKRTIDTQLKDIKHFKSSNERTKMQLLAQRDKLEQQKWKLSQELTEAEQQKQQVESRTKLLKSLARGDLGKDYNSSLDDGLRIAHSKHNELAATNPATLAGEGSFIGFREVLGISDRALGDVSSALKEVSAAVKGGDGNVLETLLESNLKLRKEYNLLLAERLSRAESADASGSMKKGEEQDNLEVFFNEARNPGPEKETKVKKKKGIFSHGSGSSAAI